MSKSWEGEHAGRSEPQTRLSALPFKLSSIAPTEAMWVVYRSKRQAKGTRNPFYLMSDAPELARNVASSEAASWTGSSRVSDADWDQPFDVANRHGSHLVWTGWKIQAQTAFSRR
jgi:hypothetical protein